MALGSTQLLTRMSNRVTPEGKGGLNVQGHVRFALGMCKWLVFCAGLGYHRENKSLNTLGKREISYPYPQYAASH
jgi:hypothetical protein